MDLKLIEETIKNEIDKEVNKKQQELYKSYSGKINEFMDDLLEVVVDEDFLRRNGRTDFKCFVAGGAITSVFTKKEINDYDIYFYSEKDFDLFNDEAQKHALELNKTDRAITYNRSGSTFQLIKLFGTPEEIFDKFDFTVCMGALVYGCDLNKNDFWNKEYFVFHDRFFLDNMSKSLVFNQNTAYPINSLFRLKKYKDKGYNINTLEMMKLALRISQMEIKTAKDIKSQVFGLSSDIMNELSAELQNISDDTIVEDPIRFIEDSFSKIPNTKHEVKALNIDFSVLRG